MKLVTSTGDFSFYVDSITEKVKAFKGSKFKYINLEQTGTIPAFFEEGEGWRKLAEEWAEAAEYAGVKYVVSHAPCLHNPCMGLFNNPDDGEYHRNLRAIRRSIEICHLLGIPRIVVHACCSTEFTKEQLLWYNQKFYTDLLDLAEKYNIWLMTENWDGSQYKFSTGAELREFLDLMDHPLLGACWDTAHGNIDPVARKIGQYENILAIGDKLKGMHISDNFGDTHHHSWPFAGNINFDSVLQGLLDVKYDGFFTFEASYTLLHQNNPPYRRAEFDYKGETVTRLLNPSLELKKKAVDLLYETGKYLLEIYDCLEE